MHRDRGYWADVSALIGRRRRALALGLGLLGACTRANPAYRIVAQQDDAAGEDNPPPPVADAAVMPDLAPPADLASLDLPAPQDRFAAAEAACHDALTFVPRHPLALTLLAAIRHEKPPDAAST